MNERNDVESVINRVAIPQFLIATVPLVFGRTQNRNLESRILLLKTESSCEGVVLRRIVDDEDFDVSAMQAGWNALKNFFYRRLRVVSDDEDEQAFTEKIGPSRRAKFQLIKTH